MVPYTTWQNLFIYLFWYASLLELIILKKKKNPVKCEFLVRKKNRKIYILNNLIETADLIVC